MTEPTNSRSVLPDAAGEETKRTRQEPLKQPCYRFSKVPACQRDLRDSLLYEISDRKVWKEMTPEILLLCNEALERRLRITGEVSSSGSKPLNLNYIADRIDVDNPMWGFCVRHKPTGWLQGFVTVTTFSSWHSWLHWDSLSVDAQLLPPPKSSDSSGEGNRRKRGNSSSLDASSSMDLSAYSPAEKKWIQERRIDRDGCLSRELEAELRVTTVNGRPCQVWPHVAEISLLGGLGAGRALLEKTLQRLESPTSQYRYVVTHATHGSIPFYEKLGFVRVGAVVRHRLAKRPEVDEQAKILRDEAEASVISTFVVSEAAPVVNVAVNIHRQLYADWNVNPHASPSVVAQPAPATVADVIFDIKLLNPHLAAEIKHNAVLPKGCCLRIPARRLPSTVPSGLFAWELWDQHIARDDDTPMMAYKQIMKKGRHPHLTFRDFLDANARHIRGLKAKSRMQDGTRLCVPRACALDFRTLDEVVGYRHWTYADEPYWDSPASYMMVRRLHRRVEHVVPAFAPNLASVQQCSGSTMTSLAASFNKVEFGGSLSLAAWNRVKTLTPIPLDRHSPALPVRSTPDSITPYTPASSDNDPPVYSSVLDSLQLSVTFKPTEEVTTRNASNIDFVNKVVRVRGGPETGLHPFYFVITYVPDLEWLRLVPMQCVGRFPTHGLASSVASFAGQPRWRLIEQGLAKELDVSASCASIVESYSFDPNADDADQDDWMIPSGGTAPSTRKIVGSNPAPPLPASLCKVQTPRRPRSLSNARERQQKRTISQPSPKNLPSKPLTAAQKQVYDALHALFLKHDTSRLSDIHTLLSRHKGAEVALLDTERSRYGVSKEHYSALLAEKQKWDLAAAKYVQPVRSAPEAFLCPKCQKSYKSRGGLRYHVVNGLCETGKSPRVPRHSTPTPKRKLSSSPASGGGTGVQKQAVVTACPRTPSVAKTLFPERPEVVVVINKQTPTRVLTTTAHENVAVAINSTHTEIPQKKIPRSSPGLCDSSQKSRKRKLFAPSSLAPSKMEALQTPSSAAVFSMSPTLTPRRGSPTLFLARGKQKVMQNILSGGISKKTRKILRPSVNELALSQLEQDRSLSLELISDTPPRITTHGEAAHKPAEAQTHDETSAGAGSKPTSPSVGLQSSAVPATAATSVQNVEVTAHESTQWELEMQRAAVTQLKLTSLAQKFLTQLQKLDQYGFFEKPVRDLVEPTVWQDYQHHIQTPMDFQTMSLKLSNDEYVTADGFEAMVADFKLICSNCKEYNGDDGNPYSKQADRMLKKSVSIIERARKKWLQAVRPSQL